MTCRGQSEYVQFMAPSLQAPLGQPPDFLPAIQDRPIDVVFSGYVSKVQRAFGCPLVVPQARRGGVSSLATWLDKAPRNEACEALSGMRSEGLAAVEPLLQACQKVDAAVMAACYAACIMSWAAVLGLLGWEHLQLRLHCPSSTAQDQTERWAHLTSEIFGASDIPTHSRHQ